MTTITLLFAFLAITATMAVPIDDKAVETAIKDTAPQQFGAAINQEVQLSGQQPAGPVDVPSAPQGEDLAPEGGSDLETANTLWGGYGGYGGWGGRYYRPYYGGWSRGWGGWGGRGYYGNGWGGGWGNGWNRGGWGYWG